MSEGGCGVWWWRGGGRAARRVRPWTLCALASCGPTDHVVAELRRDAAMDVLVDAVSDAPGGEATSDVPRDEGFCGSQRDGAAGACRGSVVATSFRYALCVCDSQALSGTLNTDSFDSARGPYTSPGRLAGSVGINGSLTVSGRLDVGGSLLAGGPSGVTALDLFVVRSLARVNGALLGSADATLADASFRGDIDARNLRVRGLLTLPAGRAVRTTGAREIARMETGDVAVAAPCDCGAAQRVPVAALVAERRSDNDNAAAGLSADVFLGASRPTRLALPCGRFYLRGVPGGGALELVIAGRVALYVDGPITLESFRVSLTPGAEIDLFVTDNVNITRTLDFGDPAAPARARMYLGGDGGITLDGDAVFGGNLHAPGVELRLAGNATVFGSALVRRVTSSGNLTVHFDQAVLDPGAGCDVPSGRCSSCRDCPWRACVDGRCAACRSDADCCAPLRCAGGRCQPEPP